MKIAARITVLLLLAAALAQTASCAWFQKNEPRIICAGESTVADAPESSPSSPSAPRSP